MSGHSRSYEQGWGFPGAGRKAHYFVDGKSLCGKWMFTGHLDEDTGVKSKDDCAECARMMGKVRGATEHKGK